MVSLPNGELSLGTRLLKAGGFHCRCSAEARMTLLATRESAHGAFSSLMKNKVVSLPYAQFAGSAETESGWQSAAPMARRGSGAAICRRLHPSCSAIPLV